MFALTVSDTVTIESQSYVKSGKGRLARTHVGHSHSKSQSELSLAYSSLPARVQLAWVHRSQALQHTPYWFVLTSFWQTVHGNLIGPGLISASRRSQEVQGVVAE